ncbi:hypothetical protein V5D56_09665 [Cellulosimicrobium sp. PMB13]|uniref:hypothetical protein n=1 Tax=Cellulosimicrobium sp. PMB13 TaxID=3120158 RepID=UPI003F4B74A2
MNGRPEPGLTPDEALRRADAWWRAAASSTGAYRAEAERAAQYWAAQHRALAAQVATRPVPVRQPSGPPHVPSYGTPAPPPYGTPAPPPYGNPAPLYGSPDPSGARWPGHGEVAPSVQARRRRLRRARGPMSVLVVLLAVVGYVLNDSGTPGPWEPRPGGSDGLPTEQEGSVPPPTVWEDPTPDAAPSESGTEARWRAGDYAQELPDPVPGGTSSVPAFLPDHPDPTEWVTALNPANEGVEVVFTDDPTYNCGMVHVEEHDAWANGVAGCFHPSYPWTLFVWWAEGADPATKEFLLAHELSHMIQWWHDFDVVQSAVDSGFAEDEEWQRAVETDASCRVLSWGGYSRDAADRSSSPCDTDEWSEGWLAERAADRGVVLRDY